MASLFHRSIAALAAALIIAAAPSLAKEKIETAVSGYPAEVVEGAMFSFTVNYDIDAALGEVGLHVEMRNVNYGVLSAQTFRVSGRGDKTVTFTAPDRDLMTVFYFAIWYGEAQAQPLVPVFQTGTVRLARTADAERIEKQRKAAEEWQGRMKAQIPEGGVAGVLIDDLPGFDQAVARQTMERLTQQGVKAVALTADEVANPWLFMAETFHMLVLTNSALYPTDGGWVIERFLAAGGDLIALNTPAFSTPVGRVEGKWMTRREFDASLTSVKPSEVLFDFEKGAPTEWGENTSGDTPSAVDFAAPGANGTGHALHVVVPDLQEDTTGEKDPGGRSFDTFRAPARELYLGPDRELTCLWAKGDAQTTSLQIEWAEKDDARWVATIPLTTEWKRFVLAPADFKYWPDNDSDGRGGPDDHLSPAGVAYLTVGIGPSHGPMAKGRHEFWVDEIGVAKSPLGSETIPEKPNIRAIAAITPSYKFHAVTNAAALRVCDRQNILPPAELAVPEGLMALQPRPESAGYNRQRRWRWIPLIEAYDKTGEVSGATAILFINRGTRLKNSMTASFAMPPAACKDPRVPDMIATVARRMREGIFLSEAGADYNAYFAGEDMNLGATILNVSGKPDPQCSVHFVVRTEDASGKPGAAVFDKTIPVADGSALAAAAVPGLTENTYRVTCTLLDAGGKPIDMLTHQVVTWRPNPQPQFMEIRDGEFYLGGRQWRAHGVNYMPSSGMATEDPEYAEYWLDKAFYDSVFIERDLRRIKALGFNMVSISCYARSVGSRNLLDVLVRCRRLGLMVNLALRPGTPLDFHWDDVKALIQAYRLAENDTVFAYDLAWEPSFGNSDVRTAHDDEWLDWIIARYGSLENAEADWGLPAPRVEGKVSGPPDEQLRADGPHRVMVAAYRRFLDDLLAKKHAVADGLVKSIDPQHFTSFRMSVSGDPTVDPAWIGYDFRGLARSVDVMEPEGYGRVGAAERVRDGRFTVDYARCMAPGRPVMWAEFGDTSWDMEKMASDPAREKSVAEFYDNFYRMAYDAGANGTVCWYFPGGYRFSEKSDFGIVNADGSWRPVSRVIREWADKMTAPRPRPPVDEWLTVDRDASVSGVAGLYETNRDRYWKLIAAGKTPGLRADGYGLDSASAPRKAVGGVPYKPGRNPHKYLDAVFDRLEIKDAEGKWQAVEEGGKVTVARGGPLVVRATVGNIADAKWLARDGNGQVGLAVVGGPGFVALQSDVPFTGTAVIEGTLAPKVDGPAEMVLTMMARPDLVFGETIRFQVEVK
jgi:hypothetical protein